MSDVHLFLNGNTIVNSNRNIPETYRQLKYLQGDGNQAFFIDYYPNENTEFEVKAQMTQSTSGQDGALCGCRSDSVASDRFVFWWNDIDWGGQTHKPHTMLYYGDFQLTVFDNDYNEKVFKFYNKILYQDDNLYIDASSGSIRNFNLKLCIFGLNQNGEIEHRCFNGKIFYFKIKENGNIIYDLYPCRRISDGILGMYDTVSGMFYSNQKSGSFTAGEEDTQNLALTNNGDVIIHNPIKSTIKFKRNDIWYLTIKFPKSILNGKTLTPEAIFRCDLGYAEKQLFRILYPKYNKKEKTYECYCNAVFFDAKYEASPIDKSHKCNNTDDNPYSERWSWNDAIQRLNTIGTSSLGLSHRYKIEGKSPEQEFFDTEPEIGELFYIFWRNSPDLNKCWDVKGGAATSGTPIQMYYRYGITLDGFNPSQVFAITPSKSGVKGEYNIRNYKSYIYTNINGAVAKDGATIMIYANSKDAIHERFTFETLETGGCKIHSVLDPSFVISRGTAAWTNGVQLCLRNENSNEEAITYVFSYVRYKQDLNFNDQNLIESLFGTGENSIVTAFEKSIALKHTTAMFDNYTCYFGDMEQYPDHLKPNDIVISSKHILQNVVTETTEERIDAIIPTGGNDKRAPSSDSRSFVKSTDYDKNSVHHVAYVTYDDLALTDDGGDIANEDALWEALAGRAKAELESGNIRKNKIESEMSIIDIIKSGSPIFANLKLNDNIYYDNDEGIREKYFIESYTYDVITGKITDIELLKEGEEV